eukprot:g564.t1
MDEYRDVLGNCRYCLCETQRARIANPLHRMQLLHLRDELLSKRPRKAVNITSQHSFLSQEYDDSCTDGVHRVPDRGDTSQTSDRGSFHGSLHQQSSSGNIDSEFLQGKKKGSRSVDIEDGKYMAMLKILPSGNLIRVVGETLPLEANKLASMIVQLHKLHRAAFYNTDNCRRFVKRCCQVQSLFTKKKLQYLVSNEAVILRVEEVIQDALEFFQQFSNRGWLERLVHKTYDRLAFEKLDRALISPCLTDHINISEESAINLQQSPVYRNSTRHLVDLLADVGGMEALRQDCKSFEQRLIECFSFERHDGLSEVLQEEIELYELSVDVFGPHTVIRHPSIQTFWRQCFGQKERVNYNEFWQHFPNRLKHGEALNLSKLLKSGQSREILQSYLTRSLPEALSITELDFLFEPGTSVEDTVSHLLNSAAQLTALGLSKGSSSISLSEGPIKQGTLFNFPLLVARPLHRRELLMHVVFGAQDKGTSFVLLSGIAGVGKRVFANQVARFLVSNGHWTEAYWISLTGITSHTSASYQIMHQIGVLFEMEDIQLLQGFLQRRQKPIGLVISGLESLVKTREDECRLLDYLEKLTDLTYTVQVLLVTDKAFKETRAKMITYEVLHFEEKQSTDWIKQNLGKHIGNNKCIKELLDCIKGHPLCFNLACSLIQFGEVTLDELLKHLQDASFASKIQEKLSSHLEEEQNRLIKFISVCLFCVDTELLSITLMLSMISEFYASCIEISSKSGDVVFKTQCLIRQSELFREVGRLKDSEDSARDALALCFSSKGEHSLETARCYQSLGETLLKLRKYNNAVESFEKALDEYNEVLEEKSLDVANCRLFLATAYHLTKKDTEALEHCLEAVQIRKTWFGSDHILVGKALAAVGTQLKLMKKERESESFYRDALQSMEHTLGSEHPEVASLLVEFSTVLKTMRKFLLAEPMLQRALQIRESVFGPYHQLTASCVQGLASLYKGMHRFEEAAVFALREVEIQKRILGPADLQVPTALMNLSTILCDAGDYSGAYKHCTRALNIREKQLGGFDPTVAQSYNLLAILLRHLGKFIEAKEAAQKSLNIRYSKHGDKPHPSVAASLNGLAETERALKEFVLAEEHSREGLNMRTRLFPEHHLTIGLSLTTLAAILLEKSKLKEAEQSIRRAISIRENHFGKESFQTMQGYDLLAEILNMDGNLEEAEEVIHVSVDTKIKTVGQKHPEVAKSLISGILMKKSNTAAAKQKLNRALNVLNNSKMKVLRLCNSVLAKNSVSTNFVKNALLPYCRTTPVSSVRLQSMTLSAKTEAAQDPPEIEYIITRKTQRKKFLQSAEVSAFITVQEEDSPVKKFTDFQLDEILLGRLVDAGFRTPTPIQSLAIPEIFSGKDCAIQSYTGSGKTLAYLLPVLTTAIKRAREEWEDASIPREAKGQMQALIIAPSQELAMQIVRVAEMLLPSDSKNIIQQLIGGANIRRQVEALKTKPVIGVGTPGRLAEHSRKGTLLTHRCPILILDEVDQLAKIQFKEDMIRLTEHTGKKLDQRQVLLVSATLTPSLIDRIGTWTPGAKFVFIGSTSAMQGVSESTDKKETVVPRWGWGNKWSGELRHQNNTTVSNASIAMPPNIRHGYCLADSRMKVDTIRRAIHAMQAEKCLIFMNYAKRTQDALYKLSARGMTVGTLHGEKSKLERVQMLAKFRNGMIRALIVSDVAARGLDVADCDAVFNLELPTDASHYAHRAGRTGRMGRVGWVLTVIERRELFIIEKLAKKLKIDIPQVEIRNGEVSLVNRTQISRTASFHTRSSFPKRSNAIKRHRRLMPIAAVSIEALFANSESSTLVTVAGLGLVSLTAIGVAVFQSPQRNNVISISPIKLTEMLNNRNTMFVDIRSKAEVQSNGLADTKSIKARFVSCPYSRRNRAGEDEVIDNFGETFVKIKGLREDSVVVLLDSDGTQAAEAAREIMKFQNDRSLYYVANGASGKGGLRHSGFPWKQQSRTRLELPKLDVSVLDFDRIAESFKEPTTTLLNTGLALGAVTVATFVLLNEFDLVLEAVGIYGGITIFVNKFLFAKDRKKTVKDLKELINDKIVAKEAADDLKNLADVILDVNPESMSSHSAQSEQPKITESTQPVANPNPVPVTEV